MTIAKGPSPRIRGEYGRPWQIHQRPGTIPANTGRIDPKGRSKDELRDHPREYGENPISEAISRAVRGPSPRIRGESERRRLSSQVPRTIPANTGRIQNTIISTFILTDHPREYGENECLYLGSDPHGGPSPRIRGESPPRSPLRLFQGTIPANTGRMALNLCTRGG